MGPTNPFKACDSIYEGSLGVTNTPQTCQREVLPSEEISSITDRNSVFSVYDGLLAAWTYSRESTPYWSQGSPTSESISSVPGSGSLLLLSTPSRNRGDPVMISPLPLSEAPSLLYPDFSPLKHEGTPFDHQFTADFTSNWFDLNTELSPVARKDSLHSSQIVFLPHVPTNANTQRSDRCFPENEHIPSQRVSLMNKFLSVTPGNLQISRDDEAQDRQISPVSGTSTLTPLSSPLSTDEYIPKSIDTPETSPSGYLISNTIVPVNHRRSHRASNRNSPSDPFTPQNSSRDLQDSPSMEEKSARHKRQRSPELADAKVTTDDCRRPSKVHKTKQKGARACSDDLPSRRRLPAGIPYHPQFPLFYRRFPVSSYLESTDAKLAHLAPGFKHPGGLYNPPRSAFDLYTPRFVKGCGTTKVGLCPICLESPSRGGLGQKVWLSMKFSAYKCYHMQYGHGISATSSGPFSPPIEFRTTERRNPAKHERTHILEGKCHKCMKWIPVESLKDMAIKVKELYWWKHAATCHQGTRIEGDDDLFEHDSVYRQIQGLAL